MIHKFYDRPAHWMTLYQWKALGYTLGDTNENNSMQIEGFDGFPYTVYAPDAVRPIKSKQAEAKRRQFVINQLLDTLMDKADHWAATLETFDFDDALIEATYHLSFDKDDKPVTLLDIFGDPILLDNKEEGMMQMQFASAARKTFDALKAVKWPEVTFTPPAPPEWKTAVEWALRGYTPRNQLKPEATTYNFDGTVVGLFKLEHCIPAKGKYERRIRYFHARRQNPDL